MAEQYGVYVSIRATSGELWSSFRETTAEVEKDINLAFGEGSAKKVLDKLVGSASVVADPTPSVPTADPPRVAASTAPASPPVETSPTLSDIPNDGFEKCGDCGTLKDVWKPPGVSKAGKAYSGFWSCPNWRNHK